MYRSRYRSSSGSDGSIVGVQCGCMILVILVNFIIGTWSVNYLLLEFLGKTIPAIGALLIGLVAGEVTIPVAIVIWLLKLFGVM
jgi:hypothetical protein